MLFGEKSLKYFIGYEDAKKINLYVYFSQKRAHIEKTLMKVNTSFQQKVMNYLKNPIKFGMKFKIKAFNGKMNTNFHNNKIPKEGSQFVCLPEILIDCVFRAGKNYYARVFLEECKYVVKEKIIHKYIIDEFRNIGI